MHIVHVRAEGRRHHLSDGAAVRPPFVLLCAGEGKGKRIKLPAPMQARVYWNARRTGDRVTRPGVKSLTLSRSWTSAVAACRFKLDVRRQYSWGIVERYSARGRERQSRVTDHVRDSVSVMYGHSTAMRSAGGSCVECSIEPRARNARPGKRNSLSAGLSTSYSSHRFAPLRVVKSVSEHGPTTSDIVTAARIAEQGRSETKVLALLLAIESTAV